MYSFSQILIGILVLLKRIMLELIHLSLVFFSRIVDMWNTLLLPIRQATTIDSFKKGVREFLDGNVWGFFNYYYYCFIDCHFFCTYLRMHFYIFNCLSFKLVFMIWLFFRWSVFYGVFDSFTDRPYGNVFLFIAYLKPLPLNGKTFFKWCVKSILLIFYISWQLL